MGKARAMIRTAKYRLAKEIKKIEAEKKELQRQAAIREAQLRRRREAHGRRWERMFPNPEGSIPVDQLFDPPTRVGYVLTPRAQLASSVEGYVPMPISHPLVEVRRDPVIAMTVEVTAGGSKVVPTDADDDPWTRKPTRPRPPQATCKKRIPSPDDEFAWAKEIP